MEAAGLDRHCDEVVVVVDTDGAKARWMLDVPVPDTEPRSFGILLAGPWTPHDFGRAVQIARNPSGCCTAGRAYPTDSSE